jgi:hypothetical protein
MGATRDWLLVATGALWFSAGGGRRRLTGSVAGAFTKRKHIPRNTPRARVGQAGQRREVATQEGVGQCSEEGRGRPVGPEWCWFGLAGRPRLREGEASGSG